MATWQVHTYPDGNTHNSGQKCLIYVNFRVYERFSRAGVCEPARFERPAAGQASPLIEVVCVKPPGQPTVATFERPPTARNQPARAEHVTRSRIEA